jgi:hypothetical protein
MRIAFGIGVISLVVGCGVDGRVSDDPASMEPRARVDLRVAMNIYDVHPVGLAINEGKRFIFDESVGLFRIDGDEAIEVVGRSSMPDPGPTAPIRPPFTDLVAYAPNVFAITALGDGYLLDIEAMTLTQHFCYFPIEEDSTPMAIEQRTDAIAFDAATNSLYAQPVTRDVAGTFIRSEIAMYDARTGDDTSWYFVEDDVAATAMITLDGSLVLAQGSVLTRRAINGTQPRVVDDLARYGVQSIDGMVIDSATNTLIVVDRVADAMFDIDLADVTLE